MIALVPTMTMLPQQDRFLRSLEAALQQAFGVSFDLWLREPSWACWNPGRPETNEGPSLDDPARMLGVLKEAAANPDTPIVRTGSDGGYLVAIPWKRTGRPPVVAAATLRMTPPELLQRLACLCTQKLHLERQREEHRKESESYLRQISRDLEELTYLYGLAEHTQYCSVSHTVVDVAEVILPQLRQVIRAEAVALVSLPFFHSTCISGINRPPSTPGFSQ